MKELGISGAVRGKQKHPSIRGDKVTNAADLVKRNFDAPRPNMLWVADFTYVETLAGWSYVAFIVDVFARKIVGFSVFDKMETDMVAKAFNFAIYNRRQDGKGKFEDLIHHNDKGSQYTSQCFQDLLEAYEIRMSIGSIGDSFDNALAESINGVYKTELIKKHLPWKDYLAVKDATFKWVHWYNYKRISERNNYKTPAEIEELWYTKSVDERLVSIRA
jgi:putative transposase